jgi:hypothetical protein
VLGIVKNSHWLQTRAAKFIASVHPSIGHNVDKIAGLKKAFYLVNLEAVPGDYMEFGMYEGTSFIGAFESHFRTRQPDTPERAFWGYDSFEGFKYTDVEDKHPFFREGDFKSNEDKVRARLKKHFKKRARWTVTKGYVEDTVGGKKAADIGAPKVAIVFIDLDLGNPARVALEFVQPALQTGSIIIFDDYFAYKGRVDRGVTRAFEEFKLAHPEMRFRRLFDYGFGGQAFIVADSGKSDDEAP